MSEQKPVYKPDETSKVGVKQTRVVQVVLHNDDHNAMEYVTLCLIKVFGHSVALSGKIMMEAHRRGRAIAEVEPEDRAQQHCEQLRGLGLVATIEGL